MISRMRLRNMAQVLSFSEIPHSTAHVINIFDLQTSSVRRKVSYEGDIVKCHRRDT